MMDEQAAWSNISTSPNFSRALETFIFERIYISDRFSVVGTFKEVFHRGKI